MATLLNAVTANTTGTGASHSGPCSVWVRGVLGGATVVIQGADADQAANYVRLDSTILAVDVFRTNGCCSVNAQGTYFLRAVLNNAGSTTAVTVETTQ
jgi:hypothetical protein